VKLYICTITLVFAAILVAGLPVQAHHSIPAFWDEQKSIEIKGTVKQMKIVNPHSELILEVTGPDGRKSDWIGVAGIASQMIKAGWTNETLKFGTAITVEGAPPRKEGAKGILVRKIILPDGRVLTSGKID